MNFDLTDTQLLLQKNLREFADAEIAPGAMERDETKTWPAEIIKQLGEMGIMGIMVPEEWGGAGMDTISYSIAVEEIARADASTSVVVSVNNSLVCGMLVRYGTDDQKERYLRSLASGATLGAFSLSEPHAGSDASNLKCRAVRDGDRYLVTGTKKPS